MSNRARSIAASLRSAKMLGVLSRISLALALGFLLLDVVLEVLAWHLGETTTHTFGGNTIWLLLLWRLCKLEAWESVEAASEIALGGARIPISARIRAAMSRQELIRHIQSDTTPHG